MDKIISVSGDVMRDVFHIGTFSGNRFTTKNTERVMGGANRALQMVKALQDEDHKYMIQNLSQCFQLNLPTLSRYIVDDTMIFETWEHNRVITKVEKIEIKNKAFDYIPYSFPFDTIALNNRFLCIIHLDYGLFNIANIASFYPDLFILDSRYRTFPIEKIEAKYKILHCTGSEYNREYSNKFDVVVNTSHNGPIRVVERKLKQEAIFQVPKCKVVPFGEIGAGDAFTATIGAYMTANAFDEMTQLNYWHLLLESIPKAIKAAQSTLDKPFRTQTELTLNKL